MSLECQRVLTKSFTESQCAYCHLVWMCCDKTSEICINHLHKRALRKVYNDNVSTFEKLLEKYKSVTIHVKNLKLVASELYKLKNLVSLIIYEFV